MEGYRVLTEDDCVAEHLEFLLKPISKAIVYVQSQSEQIRFWKSQPRVHQLRMNKGLRLNFKHYLTKVCVDPQHK